VNLYGTDVSSISGLTNYSLLKLVGETGIDLKQFPTAKHFVSWCQLSPAIVRVGNEQKSENKKQKQSRSDFQRSGAKLNAKQKYSYRRIYEKSAK